MGEKQQLSCGNIKPVCTQGHICQCLVIKLINLWLLTVYTIQGIIPTFFINYLFLLDYYNILIVKPQEYVVIHD